VGHDWGGTVAWATAATHPERVASLTVLSTPHPAAYSEAMADPDAGQSEQASYMDLLCSPMAETVFLSDDGANLDALLCGPGTTIDDRAAYREVLFAPGAFTGALNWYRANLQRTHMDGAVPVPTLHVWGDRDHAFGRAAIDATAAHVTGSYRLVCLEGAGHYLPEECPERVIDPLLEHLADHPTAADHLAATEGGLASR
jgi:pimeloyl-ACP methyl ester carboxylesterase